jgi:hypothetical protein
MFKYIRVATLFLGLLAALPVFAANKPYESKSPGETTGIKQQLIHISNFAVHGGSSDAQRLLLLKSLSQPTFQVSQPSSLRYEYLETVGNFARCNPEWSRVVLYN